MPTLTIFYGKIIDFSKCLTFFKFIFQLELHPLSLKLYKHQTVPRSQTNHVPTVVGGYSAAAIHASGGNFIALKIKGGLISYGIYNLVQFLK